jgi:hypothetical protein
MKRLYLVVVCAALSACAGRTGHPVAITESYDSNLSCDQIKAEIASNETKARQLYAENSSAHDSNVAMGVVGAVLFWPALFAIDAGTAEKDEMQALHDRNAHLQTMIDNKSCATPGTTTVAAPASPSTETVATTSATIPIQIPEVPSAAEASKACKLLNGRVIARTESQCKQIGGTS